MHGLDLILSHHIINISIGNMNYIPRIITSTLLSAFVGFAVLGAEISPVDLVNPLMGTMSKKELSTGNTYPAVAVPWGMNFWTPQTAYTGNNWSYVYTADKICGFKQTHQPSPWIGDYGQFSLMPVVGAKFSEPARASWFSHKAETATPYYYGVYLADHDVYAEMTPSDRGAVMRFKFPATDSAYVVVDAFDSGSYIKVDNKNNTISGWSTRNSGGVTDDFKNYFVVKFDTPFSGVEVLDGDEIIAADEKERHHAAAAVRFKTSRGQEICAEVASSFISPEQAVLNLKEVEGKGFDSVKSAARDRWNEVLGRIEVNSDDKGQLATFYSCLYRSLLFPRKLYEVDAAGHKVHYSPYCGGTHAGVMYTDTGFWDTFRALFPLLNLVYPEINEEIQEGLANAYRESGFLPEWASPGHRHCMVGNNSASVVADAYLKNVTKSDAPLLYKALVNATDKVHPSVPSTGRLGAEYYNSLGYIPYDVDIAENVARTLEYAYDDWCIYKMGQRLGMPEKEISKFRDRSLNYRNVFDAEHNLMRGRNRDGKFQSPFNPYKWGDAFTEGNSWHYTWSVFHDVEGLAQLMGGHEKMGCMLDSVFVVPPVFDDSYYGFCIHEIREMQIMNMGNYAHGNQPIQHMIYLYDYIGQPWKAQYRLREVMDKLYSATPDGYCGDEDNGQTSAWYVFSSLGFYPVCPGTGEYVIGTPLFDSAVITMSDGGKLKITAPAVSSENRYVNGITVNGTPYDNNYFDHDMLIKGGEIKFDMVSKPNYKRGTHRDNYPYSLSNEMLTK